jgi:hypothetical protein
MREGLNGAADETPDSRWMSYGELAEARRIAKDSAIRLVLRRGWRRQKDNHGTMRALVPPEWAQPAQAKSADQDGHLREAVSALEGAVAAMRERAETAERAVQQERERADLAEVARRAELSRGNYLRDRIDDLRAALAEAEAAVAAARTEALEAAQSMEAFRQAGARWRALGRLARIRRAWRGESG